LRIEEGIGHPLCQVLEHTAKALERESFAARLADAKVKRHKGVSP